MNYYIVKQYSPVERQMALVSKGSETEIPNVRCPVIVADAPPTQAEMQAAWDAYTPPVIPLTPRQLLLKAECDGIVVGSLTLACAEKDRSKFAQMLVLLREAEDLQPDDAAKGAFRASMQTIADAAGTTHTMSVADVRSLLVAYGAAYQSLWAAAAQSVV